MELVLTQLQRENKERGLLLIASLSLLPSEDEFLARLSTSTNEREERLKAED